MTGRAFVVANNLSDSSNRDDFISHFYKFNYMIYYYILQWFVQFSQENMHWWANKHACGC